jgi:hypothetical protein
MCDVSGWMYGQDWLTFSNLQKCKPWRCGLASRTSHLCLQSEEANTEFDLVYRERDEKEINSCETSPITHTPMALPETPPRTLLELCPRNHKEEVRPTASSEPTQMDSILAHDCYSPPSPP